MATLAIFGSGCTPDPATKTAPKEMTAPKSSGGAMTPELRAAYIQAVQADASEEHRITRTEAGKLKATSPAQRLTATFATDGVTLDPTESDASHGSMALRGYGCEGDLEAGKLTKVSRAEPTFEGNRVEYRRAELVEWYLNGPLGLEQGFTIPAPPQCRNGKGALVLELELGGGLSAELRSGDPSDPGAAGATPTGAPASTSISAKGSELVLHHAEAPAVLRYTDLFARDAAGRQVPAWLTITKDRPAIHVNDAGAVYPLEIDPLIWHQQAKLLPAGGAAMDHFGVSVAIDQDTAIVGASNDDGSKGSAFVFVRSNGVWTQQQKLVPDNGAVSSGFGGSVSISQDTAIVGETQHVTASGNVGAAYVFVRSNGTWTKQQTLLASDGNADDSFGHAVSVSGDTAVVTASLDDDKAITAGAAYVFVRSNGTWTESQKLFANDAQANNYFGESVAVSGSTAIVGAFGSDSFKGSAYVFGKSGGTWTQQQKLVASDGAASDDFGRSIALSGNTAVVGAHGDDSDKGAAYVFVENGGTWTQQQKLVASDGVAGDFFGVSVAVSGDTAMVGARSEDNTNGADAGAAYIFLRNGSMWSQDVKLLASDGAANDQFGRSVAVSMTTAVVGAPFNNTAGADSGTAYVFLRASVGQACSVNADCETNFCVDGVCCNSACGGTNTTDCQACSVAAGATQDGLCGLRSAGALCRTSVGACDVAETCNGSSDTCPANVFAAAGTPCNDDNACTQTDACQAGGACAGANHVTCVALDQCHDAGVCDPGTGVCSDPVKADGVACNDGDACTQTDTCQAGACEGASPVVCAVPDQCHDQGVCDPATGVCSNPAKVDGEPCDDADVCTQTDTCQAGACSGASPVTCQALDQCHDPGLCNPITGCSHPPKANGVACNDGDACSKVDTCQSGVCVGASPIQCPAFDQCHDAGACDPATGLCSNPPKQNGSPCNDSNFCTKTDACQSGACVGSNPQVCPAPNDCNDAACDPGNGQCVAFPKLNGTACSDGDQCTQIDACQAGACVGSSPVQCPAPDQCHVVGACNTTTGICSNPPKPNGAACDDSNACTQTDTCQAGACVGANATPCPLPDQCHHPGTCDPMTGVCSNPAKVNGAVCSDGNACTVNDSCQAGACASGSSIQCPAPDQCHEPGTCDSATGICSNPPKAAGSPCDDKNLCTTTDTCKDGACVGAEPVICLPLGECYDPGTCAPETGVCSSSMKANDAPCSDKNLCTLNDTCQNGVCTSGLPTTCAAISQCHEPGVCDAATGQCSTPQKPDSAVCNDENECTFGDECNAGKCTGEAIVCAPLDVCHPGVCDKSSGKCSYAEIPNCSLPGSEPPPPPASAFQTCTSAAECETGFCVDGVCCDTACQEICHTCVQPSAIGTCQPSPIGSDLRHDCGNPGDCVKTCGGPENPACVDSIPGTECLPSECLDDGLHGLGPAFCPAPGAKCALNDRAPFDCAPYRCVKQSGQCGLQCASSDDCAPPFVCDPAQRCVPPPPVASGQPSSCAFTPNSHSGAGLIAPLLAALALCRRRRAPASKTSGLRPKIAALTLVAPSALGLGCSSETEAVNSSALRSAFAEQAAVVLGRGAGFTAGDDQFVARAPSHREGGRFRRLEAELPRRASDFIRLRTTDGFEVRVRELGARGDAILIERSVAYAREGGASYWTASAGAVEEWLHLVGKPGEKRVAWEIDGASLEQRGELVAVVDEVGAARVWISAPAAFARGGRPIQAALTAAGTTRLELSVNTDAEEVLLDPMWTTTAPMGTARKEHRAVLLADGTALIAGGKNPSNLSSAEIFDPLTQQFTPTVNTMQSARFAFSATRLDDGTVLVAGGRSSGGALDTADLYNPVTKTFSPTASMADARRDHTAVLLADGTVLVAGGISANNARMSAEIYNPSSHTWAATNAMASPRGFHTATLLGSGKILVAGGSMEDGPIDGVHANCEIFDPSAGTWSAAGPMLAARIKHVAVLLANGKVLVAGGSSAASALATAEIYDPTTNTWSQTAPMSVARSAATAALLPTGAVLVAGGNDGSALHLTAETYDPTTGQWASTSSMSESHSEAAGAVLADGSVLITGGASGSAAHANAELYAAPAFCAQNGASCDDGDPCTQTDTCQGGACVGASPVQCAALDQCHDVGVCNPATGVCSDPAKADGAACNDGDACSNIDTCQSGACVGASPVQCVAFDQCHDAGSCDPATGLCSNPPKPNGSACDDANFCTLTDACQVGTCAGSNPKVCSAPNNCNDAACDPGSGQCLAVPKADGTSCNDSNQCTQTDTCQSGACVGASPVQCSALNQCHVAGACNPATGICSNPPKPNGSACDDANACTQTDTCQSGACAGGAPKTCAALDQCHTPGTCDPATGICSNPVEIDGAACSDGNACTVNDSCQAGACTPGSSIQCAISDQCHGPGTCDPATGICSKAPKPNGSTCDDANACTQTDTCQAGACVGASPKVCAALDQCHDPGTCDPKTGECPNPVKADGAACSDGNACTLNDTCQAGACVSGASKMCAALDQCHNPGTCDEATGQCSSHPKPDSTACDDSNECTLGDECKTGKCSGEAIVCPPLDACHPGVCDKSSGKCSYTELSNCSLPDSGPPPPPPVSTFQTCTSAAECATGHCVDGVCCDTACQEICHTCVQPIAIGTCLPSPLGSDLRHDCGNPGDCVKTCGGPENPACVDSIPGTECLPSECLDDGLHGLGPAFCPAPGAKCAINDRAPFDCAPYRCVKQSGQCGLQCASSDDCAPPFVCDPAQRCVPPPPIASGQPSTCAAAPGPSSINPGVTALFAALAASYLRRRRRPAAQY